MIGFITVIVFCIIIPVTIPFRLYAQRKREREESQIRAAKEAVAHTKKKEVEEAISHFKSQREYYERQEREEAYQEKLERVKQKAELIKRFAALPGGDFWDASIHLMPSQQKRYEQSQEQDIIIEMVAEDSRFRMMKVKGAHQKLYVTSGRFCTCYDFKKNQLPCKHMYAMTDPVYDRVRADPRFTPLLPESESLKGLSVLLMGRFRCKEATIALLEKHGADVNAESPFHADIVVTEQGKEDQVLEDAKNLHVPILTEQEAFQLFCDRPSE